LEKKFLTPNLDNYSNKILFLFSLQDFKEAACDKNEAKNISLLYNLPGVAGPSGVARTSAGNGAIPKVNCAKIQKNGGKTGVARLSREMRENSNSQGFLQCQNM
jgi:hypothetical protein